MDQKPYFITTPIYYINSTPHVGHAYTQIAADARARFERLRGREVYFLTGTDENALKVARVAEAQGRDPLEFCDELAQAFKDVWHTLNISYDDFLRTTEERHRKPVREVVQRLWDNGFLELGKYSGWYSVPDETFFREEEVEERGGGHFLINPTEDQTKEALEWVEETGHFFKLSGFGDQLLKIYADAPDTLRPESRRNETLRFIERGLFDTSISRAQNWGIPLPDGVPESSGKVVYVWFPDALLNYATAPGFLADDERFKTLWPPDLQLMSKDIFTRFHATLWPALLLALDLELPRELFAHGFWTVNGKKIGKRDPETVVEPIEFATQIAQSAGETELRVGVDALRYYSLREVTFGADGDFSTTGCVARYNSDLANGLGNLVQRDVVMLHKYFEGRVPAAQNDDGVWLSDLRERQLKVERAYETLDFSGALSEVWEVVGMANRWIEDEKPWAKIKEGDLDSVASLLNRLLVASQWVAVCTFPVMPSSATLLWSALGRTEPMAWPSALVPFEVGHVIPAPSPIFPRADLKKFDQIERAALEARDKESKPPMQHQAEQSAIGTTEMPTGAQVENALNATEPAPPTETAEPTYITIDDFAKVQLRVGKVLEAERIPKADKLLRLQVDLGDEKRQILAGIAQHYTPDEMIGRNIVIVANLAPRTMRGYESQGMLLAASDNSGKLSLINPGEVDAGGTVR